MHASAFDAGFLRPHGGRLWDGVSPLRGPAALPCRCLLLEHPQEGLVLVDTGFGLRDAAEPGRIAAAMRWSDRPTLSPDAAAITQLRRAGLEPRDVRHIVMTHLDFDHAGGLDDFPWATIHVSALEAAAARAQDGVKARQRWRPAQLAAAMQEHATQGPGWFGFATLGGLPDGLLLVPLPGHSPGHCGVAIRHGNGWLLHAGDAVFMHGELEAAGHAPPLARAYEAVMQSSAAQRHASADALRALHRAHPADVAIICTHDPRLPPWAPLPAL